MIYITGDTHCDFSRFEDFCEKNKTTTDDIMIILGDSGLNFYGNYLDRHTKEKASAYPLTFFCIHGNHEKRASGIDSYKTGVFCGGTVYFEEDFPSLLFAKDGEIYRFGEHDCIVIGGAYSIDKTFRLAYGYPWYADEQPSDEIKNYAENALMERAYKIDVVLSHTCPKNYEPTEVFLKGIDQSSVDKSTEIWLAEMESMMRYKYWYCGHFHTQKKIDRLRFMFKDIDIFMNTEE